MTYRTTDSLDVALANNYIGEVDIAPTIIADAVSVAYSGERLMEFRMFYCGYLNDDLRKMFGYPLEV